MTEQLSNDLIWIITTESIDLDSKGNSQDIGGGFGRYDDQPIAKPKKTNKVALSTDRMKQEMSSFLNSLKEIFSQVDQKELGMTLDEVELSIEIDSRGKVCLLGIGADLGSKGVIKLKLKRKDID